MGKLQNNQKGFSAPEGLLVLVIVGVIGLVGWYVWHNRTTKPTASANTSTTSKSSTTPSTTKTAADTYTGWKTYCDTATSGCFRYPADWNNIVGATGAAALSGTNKNETIVLEYTEPVDGTGGLGDFVTKSIDSLASADTSYKVVGGYYTVGNIPGYNLVDGSLAQQLGLSSGKTTKISNNDLYFTKSTNKANLVVHFDNTSGSTTIEQSQANSWFDFTDGKTALKIVQSFYNK